MCSPLQAELTRFEIQSREPFAGGSEFGAVGAYERIVGRAFFDFALSPDVPRAGLESICPRITEFGIKNPDARVR